MSTVKVTALKHEDASVDNLTLNSDGTSTLAGNLVFSDASVQTTAGDLTATELNATGTAPMYACRSWVNFNGTGTVAIRASGNVSSITDNGTGDYTVNFTTAMLDANYCVNVSAPMYSTTNASIGAIIYGAATPTGSPGLQSSTQIRVCWTNDSGAATFYDPAAYYVSVFR